MKKKIKILSILCSVIMLFSMAACNSGSKDSSGSSGSGSGFKYKGLNIMDNLGSATGTVSFHVGGGQVELRLWDKLIDGFEKQNPGIKVEKVTINDMDVLYTQLLSGTAPDVIQMESPDFGSWAKAGALQSVQPLVERDNFDTSDYWPQLIEMYSFDTNAGVRGSGDLFALPKDMGVNGIFVNRKLVNEAKERGALTEEDYKLVTDQVNPMTYEQYLNVAKKLTKLDPNNSEYNIYGTNRIYWESYVWSAGDDILTEDYQLNTESKVLKEVFEYSKAMVTEGGADYCAPYTPVSSVASQDEMSMFMTDRIAMYWSGRWMVPNYDAANMDYYCIPMPVVEKEDGTRGESVGWCSTIGYGVSRNCKNGEMAWKLIQYLTSLEGYRVMNELNYNVPGRMSLITEEAFANPQTNGSVLDEASAKVFFNMAKTARINNAARLTSSNWIETFESKLSLYFTGEIATYEALMSGVSKQVNASIKKSDPQLFNK